VKATSGRPASRVAWESFFRWFVERLVGHFERAPVDADCLFHVHVLENLHGLLGVQVLRGIAIGRLRSLRTLRSRRSINVDRLPLPSAKGGEHGRSSARHIRRAMSNRALRSDLSRIVAAWASQSGPSH
jgi:hypothetical protein